MGLSPQDWYEKVRTRVVDLVGDYAGKELFLVEGDSLLLECFRDRRIDFQDGFQLLHAVYAVEKYLDNLVSRGCKFSIVFFDDHAELCVPSASSSLISKSRYLLARSAIKQHLHSHLPISHPNIEVLSFSTYHIPAFRQYLESAGVYFVMCHDGSHPAFELNNDEDTDDEEEGKVANVAEDSPARAFRAMILWFAVLGFNVALVNEVEWRDSKVMTRVVEGYRYRAQEAVSTVSEATVIDQPENPGAITEYISTVVVSLINAHGNELGERDYLTLACLSKMLRHDMIKPLFALAILMHLACLKNLSLVQRRIATISVLDKKSRDELNQRMDLFSKIAVGLLDNANWRAVMRENGIKYDVEDMIDGRLLTNVFYSLQRADARLMNQLDIQKDFGYLLAALRSLSEKELLLQQPNGLENGKQSKSMKNPSARDSKVLPFSSPIFDKHLESIHISIDESASNDYEQYLPTISRELTHWHNKRPLDQKKAMAAAAKTSTRRYNPLRANQKYMAEMTAYAASLTNSKGKTLTPEIITQSTLKGSNGLSVGGRDHQVKEQKPKGQKVKDLKGKKDFKPSKADQIIADNKAKKENVDRSRALSGWDEVRKRLDKVEPETKYLEVVSYYNGLDDSKSAILRLEVDIYRLQALLYQWAILCKNGKKGEGYGAVALIWDIIRSLNSSRVEMTAAAEAYLESVSLLLGLPKPKKHSNVLERRMSFQLQLPQAAPGGTLLIDMPPWEFQLTFCGPYMDRNTDARPDSRVTSFEPDGWQRHVLDELDANHSVFVVAPTSAGKTFISFYAMEKVLRESNDGILVYVAPTKALVNQIAAEVHAKYTKSYPHGGHSIWAIHTRDYRINNPSGCQILVTVPHILQIMLLAPSNAQKWAPKVKCIIFDEIHSIGQAEDGVVWEQLLLLAPCQIIALSATVGNPQEFNDWLASTQAASGLKLTIIQYKQRYSDLRKFVFQPPKNHSFTGLSERKPAVGILGLDGTPNICHFHPVASLVNKSRGVPDDLTLEPRDCLVLWRTMVMRQTKAFPVPKTLDPAEFLPEFMRRVDIFAWERALKIILIQWMDDNESPFNEVMYDLSGSLYKEHLEEETVLLKGSKAAELQEDVNTIEAGDLRSTTMPLLVRLHERNALPAILFNYDRFACEEIAKSLLSTLQTAEERHKGTSLDWKKLIEGFEKWSEVEEAKKAKKNPKTTVKKKKKKGKGDEDDDADDDEPSSKADAVRDGASQEKQFYEAFDPTEPLGAFSFANIKRYEASELKKDLRTLQWKGIADWLGEALKRGIGVHHAGMNRKYRQVVEVLFRRGFLRVVIATGTLALGINMPCTTVVFSGDSIFLTALNYRQAAGRAGRRGFDLMGNVIFQGISTDKVCRLVSSRLPDLNGHFPITTTLVLRLFILLYESDASPYAEKAIESLLSQPRLYLGGENFKHQVLHHLRWSIDYLRRQSLLNAKGEPINFATIVSHLYYTENSSFAFNALLRASFWQQLCKKLKGENLMRTMMLVMSHLFCRQPCRTVQQEFIETVIKRSSSIVFLPAMPAKAAKILRKHNMETLATFSTYVKTFAEQHIKEGEAELPLTHTSVGGTGNNEAAAILKVSPPTDSRSAFVALSGLGDDFESIADLCTSVRNGVFLEQAVVPHLELYPEDTKSPLNAYLLDFFKHGALEPLEIANGIRKSDVWFHLNDFSLILATIVTSLANFLHLKNVQDLDMIDLVGDGDALEIDADEKLADEMEPTPKVQPEKALPVRKTKPVADSWDDEEENVATLPSSQREKALENQSLDEMGLMPVYKAFVQLKQEFDEKFRAIEA